ncbi:hypothetical protein LTR62_005200 [Meristemomyces frigidus]|uniref:Uncharacterized protein n=1 Tax=Meristemomyces frigidus TaxID=1508187 RepID=A0AAN7TEK9_9PEZI|nr:hypothetical protein LTR62_005200 [Meristemomyces frigidus]
MKFAKELDDHAVPEWRGQYLDYKQAKKKLKAVTKAIRNVERPEDKEKPSRKTPHSSLRDAPVTTLLRDGAQAHGAQPESRNSDQSSTPLFRARSKSLAPGSGVSVQDDDGSVGPPRASPININERSPLRTRAPEGPKLTRYGSIIGTPPDADTPVMLALKQAPSLVLPAPAMEPELDPDYDRPISPGSPVAVSKSQVTQAPSGQLAHTGNAYKIGPTVDISQNSLSSRYRTLRTPQRTNSTPSGGNRPFVRRMFSIAPTSASPGRDVALETYREVDFRQAEFFLFLDKELNKIGKFYKQKEEDAEARLKVLREQLHVMRDRRLEEILAAEQKRKHLPSTTATTVPTNGNHIGWAADMQEPLSRTHSKTVDDALNEAKVPRHPFQASLEVTRGAIERVRTGHVGKTSRAMGELSSPQHALGASTAEPHDPSGDYTRRPTHGVSYRAAKRKLKLALAEFYRGLELLKSYALLNHTAFRKINKKYDKAVNAHPNLRYMAEKVNKAHFVASTTPDDLITQTEDLYARYFERGNHKVAVGKLRARIVKAGDYTGPIFRTGILLALGACFGIQGIVNSVLIIRSSETSAVVKVQTEYLQQIYAGYFLVLLSVLAFCADAAVFSAFKVNYQFIFEFDSRDMLHWEQLAEMPAYFWFLLGFFMWCNFGQFENSGHMFVYWPVILVGLSLVLLYAPPPLFYPRSRRWFIGSNWRLLLAGAFPVEFRDFFLGDMYCSQTYAMGNIELFFCLYAHHWSNEPQCNSSHSRLLGFFQCLPGIWRLLQCFRRYYDSRLWTHLANGAKYTCTILQYLSLSLWRINRPSHGDYHYMAFFISMAGINSLYCCFWDLQYDWSMPLNPYSRPYPFLRKTLAYRKHVWYYYVAMILDVCLRFNWIFYIIYKDDAQHSSIVSFLISLSEVIRRSIWVLFRVENEHCANVGRSRALRDPALPFDLQPETTSQPLVPSVPGNQEVGPVLSSSASGREDVETGNAASSLRQRRQGVPAPSADSPVYRALQRAGTTFVTAHAMDYEKKRVTLEDVRKEEEDDDDDDGDEEDSDGD